MTAIVARGCKMQVSGEVWFENLMGGEFLQEGFKLFFVVVVVVGSWK